MKTRLIVFDLDGTLLNTIGDLSAAVNHALEASCLPLHTEEEYLKMVGHGVRNLVTSALPEELRSDGAIDSHLSVFKDYYSLHIDVLTRPYPGIPELLSELSDAGVRLAVASNKFQAGVELLMARFFPGLSFVSMMGNGPGAPLKPDPAIVRSAVVAAGVEDMSGVMMVGDSATDINTGKNAGVRSVGVSWGFRPKESLVAAGADFVADSVEELRDFLLESLQA